MATGEVLDLRDYTRSISRRRRWVVVSTVVGAILALGMSLSRSATYQSSSEVLVLPVTIPGAEVSPNSVITMPTELQIAESSSVAAAAANIAADQGFHIGTVEVTNPVDTQTLAFVASAPDAAAAKATATAFADAYLKFRQENLLASVTARLESVRALLDDLDNERKRLVGQLADANSAAETAAIQFELQTVSQEQRLRQQEENELNLAAGTDVGRVLEQAVEPAGPSSPRPIRDAIIGAALGFIIGIGLALLRDRLDQRVRNREDVEAVAEAPVLGFIPEAKSLHRMISLLPGGDQTAAEAFRTLRTRVLFAASKEGFRSIMVTSTSAYEGKTTTATNLAVALAQADTRVVLVSADLHHPGMWRYLPERGKLGLADVLAGNVGLASVVIPTDQENLYLLPSGTLARLPEAALGSADMLAVIEQLKEQADLVVLDSAPVLGVSDTLELASIVDTVLLTVDATQAKKDTLRETVHELRSVGAAIVGIALHRPEGAHFEGYSHRYGYREHSERSATLPEETLTKPDERPKADPPASKPAPASKPTPATKPAPASTAEPAAAGEPRGKPSALSSSARRGERESWNPRSSEALGATTRQSKPDDDGPKASPRPPAARR